jgi:hypothetical protein
VHSDTEIIQRLTRVEEKIAGLIEAFDKFERALVGESGANGKLGRLEGRVTVLERSVGAIIVMGTVAWALIKFAAGFIQGK